MIAGLGELIARRDLLVDFAWRDLRARYKGSALGFAWHFVMPISQLVVFWVLFGILFGIRPRTETGEQPYAVFPFVGLLPWTFFATAVTSGASAIVANAAILFPVSIVADRLQQAFLLYLNPMTAVIVAYQRALLDGLAPEWPALLWSAAFAVLMLAVGCVLRAPPQGCVRGDAL